MLYVQLLSLQWQNKASGKPKKQHYFVSSK